VTGRLKVAVRGVDSQVRPTLDVIDSSMRLQATARPGEEVELPAGAYVIRATLPDGRRPSTVATVEGGVLVEATLEETVAVPPGPEDGIGTAPNAEEADPGPPVPWAVRFVMLRDGAQARPQIPPLLEVADYDVVAGERLAAMVVHPRGDEIVFAQIATPDAPPLNVALPTAQTTQLSTCWLHVTISGGKLHARARLLGTPVVAAATAYVEQGLWPEASDLLGDVRELVYSKLADPLAASLGGYALIRLHQLDGLRDWAGNLATWFPWLPDGAVIDGECAALENRHADALVRFVDAARRGLPVFVDGFSMLVSRLRQYSLAPPPGTAGPLRAEAARQAKRLLPLSPLVDLNRLTVAFPGANVATPLTSQRPARVPRAVDGWRQFVPRRLAEDPRDYWKDAHGWPRR
jgi:hypothetical protein